MKKIFIGILIIVSAVISTLYTQIVLNKKIANKNEILNKFHEFYVLFDRWLQIHQEGKTLVEYFQRKNYKTVAIYGMKKLGERLYDELKNSDITVSYIIDKNADVIYADVDVVTLEEELKPVDAIVVTAVYYFDDIKETLGEKIDYPIISLGDILYEV